MILVTEKISCGVGVRMVPVRMGLTDGLGGFLFCFRVVSKLFWHGRAQIAVY